MERRRWGARREGAGGGGGGGSACDRGSWLGAAHAALTAVLAVVCVLQYKHALEHELDALTSRSALSRMRSGPSSGDGKGGSSLEGLAEAEIPQGYFLEPTEPVEFVQVRLDRKAAELEETRTLLLQMERDLRKCQGKLEDRSEEEAWGEEKAKLQARDRAMQKRLERVEDGMAKLSRHVLRETFGSAEPYRVRMTVRFPESMGAPYEQDILFEMAPSEHVPTGVLYFMNQVEAGLWDGCSFIRNAHHVLQASPQSTEKHGLHRRFKELPMQGSSIAFQEYSDKYKHTKYTIGLAGRPGGPDFYISTVDNTRNHGPGGQSSYDLPAEADTCFGRVAEGHDVVDRMHRARKLKDNFESLAEYIEIKTMRVERASDDSS
ncbi:Hypothetical Protein FCC1311_051132 [Hondaea fermentalgiana]|uniref:PPIase cyclophilin-type domain-containing protein n=1 Tax=Hondaea fermentalgiana TaxID=2315210 RepID=A0A2R5GD42_9STRA|nr:Hypothetical Protein FCC1311_051132 [Hondaea fermentalgiana]|eukprot:GBG28892.1 Hypothetical Protein FCC1311_051132 [Hondaea fermentalgiana]